MRWIFFKFKHFDQYFLCTRCWFGRSFKRFSLPNTIINFLFFSLQWITSYLLTETLFKISFSVIGRVSVVPTSHWLQGKCARTNLSQANFGMILGNYRRLLFLFKVKIAAVGSLRRVTGRIFKISKQFQRCQLKL